jgi:hypothetical protein
LIFFDLFVVVVDEGDDGDDVYDNDDVLLLLLHPHLHLLDDDVYDDVYVQNRFVYPTNFITIPMN